MAMVDLHVELAHKQKAKGHYYWEWIKMKESYQQGTTKINSGSSDVFDICQ